MGLHNELTYTQLAPTTVTKNGGSASWIAWDLSAVLPSHAKYASISFEPVGGSNTIGVRANNATLDTRTGLGNSVRAVYTVPLDSTRIVEVYEPGVNSAYYALHGYWS